MQIEEGEMLCRTMWTHESSAPLQVFRRIKCRCLCRRQILIIMFYISLILLEQCWICGRPLKFCDVSADGGLSEKSLESVAIGAVADHLGVKDTLQAEPGDGTPAPSENCWRITKAFQHSREHLAWCLDPRVLFSGQCVCVHHHYPFL